MNCKITWIPNKLLAGRKPFNFAWLFLRWPWPLSTEGGPYSLPVSFQSYFLQSPHYSLFTVNSTHFAFTAAEVLDPKAKETSSPKSPFPWARSRGDQPSPKMVKLPPAPPPIRKVESIQEYARTQEQHNASCLSKTEHRYCSLSSKTVLNFQLNWI